MAGVDFSLGWRQLMSPVWLFGLFITTGLVYFLANAFYNVYFHPLARFPGPLLWRATTLPLAYRFTTRRLSRDMLEIHKKYGPVVRIAPNELAFNTPEALKDIYGHKPEGRELPRFATFYRTPSIPPSIISETRHNHALMRRALLPRFSERKIQEQEPIIAGYIDLLIKRLREHSVEPEPDQDGELVRRPMDMVSWYTWTTFDIIGDLAFGEPFGCLERAKYDPWVGAVAESLPYMPAVYMAKYMGLGVLTWLAVKVNKPAAEHRVRTIGKLKRRLQLDVERPDLIEGFLQKKDEWGMENDRLIVNASVLIGAGSETSATLLSGVTYLLLRTPDALKKVTEEIRSAFKSEGDMTFTSVGQLTYLTACISEALRRYPPVSIGLPRFVPEGRVGTMIAGHNVPEKTIISVWQYAANHNPEYFVDPFGYHPERFLQDPKFAQDRLDVVQPFLLGPTDCIGRTLAYAEMRLILARILYAFDLELVNKDVDWFDQKVGTLWEKPPLPVYLTPVRGAL